MAINWAEVAANGYAVPQGISPAEQVPKLLEMLGHPDPAVRDEQAYVTLATWLEQGHLDTALREIGDQCAVNLSSENVLLRSFSALILAECLARGRKVALLDAATAQHWYAAWKAWYPHESDVRSYDNQQGWIHTVAHGADVAAEWARRDLSGLERLELAGVLQARLQTLPDHLSQTEDDRLAMALLSIFSSPSFGSDELQTWSLHYRTLWTSLEAGKIPPSAVLAVRTLHSLHTLLHLGATIGGEYLTPAHPEEAIKAVQDAIKTIYPYYGQP